MNFIVVIFFSLVVSATDDCVPDQVQVKVCQQFVKEVLTPAVFEDSSLPDDAPQVRFVKDEKQAVNFLKNYEPTKLAIPNQQCIYSKAIKDYASLENVKGPLGCDTAFGVLNYFRGLTQGMKLNGWNKETIRLGEGVIQKHVEYVFSSPPSLLEAIIVFSILGDAQKLGFLQGVYPDAVPFNREADKLSEDLTARRKALKKPYTTEQMQDIVQRENQGTVALIKKWKLAKK